MTQLPWLELIRFGAMGALSVGIYLVCLVPLTWLLPGLLWLAGALAYLLSMAANYVLQRHVTFRSSRQHREAVSRYLVVHAVGMGLNAGILHVVATLAEFPLWFAQGAAVGCVAIWSYGAQKYWVFMDQRKTLGEAVRSNG